MLTKLSARKAGIHDSCLIEVQNLICCWRAAHELDLHSADATSAYFQGRPLDRVLLMRQPRGGIPGIEDGVVSLVRVPIYGLTDSGCGFWLRLDGDAKKEGMKASQFFPSFSTFQEATVMPVS